FRIAETQGWAERMARAALAASSYLVMDPAQIPRFVAPIEAALAALGPEARPERARLLGRRAVLAHFTDANYDAMEAGLEGAEAGARLCGEADAAGEIRRGLSSVVQGSPYLAELDRWAQEAFESSWRSDSLKGISQGLFSAALARGDRPGVESRLEEHRALGERTGSRSARRPVLACGGARVHRRGGALCRGVDA